MINIHNYFAVNWEATSDNIRSLIRNNASYQALAEAMCVSKRTIENWCNNKSKPSIDNLIIIAKLFNLNLQDILVINGQLSETITKEDYEEACEMASHSLSKDERHDINSREEVYSTIIFNELIRKTYPITTLEEFVLILPLVSFSDLHNFFERINGNIGINQDYLYNQLKFLYDRIPNGHAKKYVEIIKEYYLKYPNVYSIYDDSQISIKQSKVKKCIEEFKTENYKTIDVAYHDMLENFLDKLYKR